MLNPTQITRLLALPIGWRRRLAAMPGPGWWYKPNGFAWSNDGHLVCDRAGVDVKTGIADGWAWAPADRLAWLAATDALWSVDVSSGLITWVAIDGTPQGDIIDAALSYFETNDQPEVK